MQSHWVHALRSLIDSQRVAALATLHRGKPAVSMVPYALLPNGEGFVVHVSSLATHTADMLASPDVALLIVAGAVAALSPREWPRLSVQGHAQRLAPDSPAYDVARERYLARFPDSADIFGFSDFSLFAITGQSARFVGGFADARSVRAEEFRAILSQAS